MFNDIKSVSCNSIIGIDIGGTTIKGGIVNDNGEIFYKKIIKTDPAKTAFQIVSDINFLIKELEKSAEISNMDIKGIGIASPGYPDNNGLISFIPNIPNLANFPIKKHLTINKKVPILFENDGNASAFGEYIFGQKKKFKDIIILTLGTGIASGIIANGSILKGKNGISGELGHITVKPNGPICYCGKKGCLEIICSANALNASAKEKVDHNYVTALRNYKPKEINPKIVADEARKGDMESKKIYLNLGKWLGFGMSIFINVLNPEKIILAGGIARDSELFMEPMLASIKKNIHPQFRNGAVIEISKFKDNLGIIGAASLLLR
ncbi:MAG: ROK family protein [Candidatus Humimicrobiaceae bacterium]